MTKKMKKFGLGLILLALLLLPGVGWGQNSCDSSRADLNNSGSLDPTDVVLLLNCTFFGTGCGVFPRGDLNCDGLRTSWDVYLSLRAVFLGECIPCGPVAPTTPDPADSIIIESKLVLPGADAGPTADTSSYLYVRVFITNKDSLANITLPLEIRSASGGAYIIAGYPRNINGTISRLTGTLGSSIIFAPRINSSAPDSATWAGFSDVLDPPTIEPPNATRKALWDLKFDTVNAACGLALLDSIRIFDNSAGFVKLNGTGLPVNFVRGVITVGSASPAFDLRASIRHFGSAVKGSWRWVRIRCENIGGACPTVPTMTWKAPPQAEAIFAYPRAYPIGGGASVPASVTPISSTSLLWTLPGLANGDGYYLWARYKIPCGLPNATVLTNIARCTPVTDDTDSLNNTAQANKPAIPGPGCPEPPGPLAGQLTGAAEKFSSTLGGTITAIDTITYVITFQNTGSGTVGTAVVRDTLDSNLDEATFDTAGASHSPVTVSRVGRVLTWTFPGINLPNRTADPVASMGFVAFRVLPDAGIPQEDTIINDAEITFDGDPPVPSGTVPIITCPRVKGDLVDGQFLIDVSDIVQMLICAFPLTAPDPAKCDPCYADVDCTGGDPSPTDVVTMLNRVFLDEPIDCQ